jgi:flagellar protein FliS
MFNGAHDRYLESRVLTADPLELVRMLYQGAIGAVREARQYLEEGKIFERSRSISRAIAILTEFTLALDHERGGEIAGHLAGLYDYMQKRLLEANFKQIGAPLEEVLDLLMTLSEGWVGISQAAESPAPAATPWSQTEPQELEANCARASWSL